MKITLTVRSVLPHPFNDQSVSIHVESLLVGEFRDVSALCPASSLPTSPAVAIDPLFMSPKAAAPRTPSPRKKAASPSKLRISPTHMLRETFESVCVSPEKKKSKVVGSDDESRCSSTFTIEERMAPWSPQKPYALLLLWNSSMSRRSSMAASGNSPHPRTRLTVKERVKKLKRLNKT